jgi:hypothetical protein
MDANRGALTIAPAGPSRKRSWKIAEPTGGVGARVTGRSPQSSELKAPDCASVTTRHCVAPQTLSAPGWSSFAEADPTTSKRLTTETAAIRTSEVRLGDAGGSLVRANRNARGA